MTKQFTSEVLPTTIRYRLWFLWMILWGSLCTIVFSTVVLIHNFFQPSLKTFHFWSGLWARVILWGFGMRTQVRQHVALDPTQPYIFISNHQNSLDILVEAGYVPVPFGFLAKVELKTIPFIGMVLRTFCVFVDRSTPRKAIESMLQGGELVKKGHSILIYPEGERTWSNQMVEWMRGAFELAITANVPIVPLTLVDNYRLGDERRFIAKPGVLHFVIHEPISLAGKTRKDVPALMQQVQQVIEEAL